MAARTFPDGVAFRTFCADCNNRLGSAEDKEFLAFSSAAKQLFGTGLALPDRLLVPAKPNLVGKAVLSYLLAANDVGYPGAFDVEAQDILLGRKHIRELSETIFYWSYLGNALCVIRDTIVSEHFFSDTTVSNIVKFRPFGFLVSAKSEFHGATRLNDYFAQRDDDVRSLPIVRSVIDRDASWPARPTRTGVVLMGAGPAFIATPRRRSSAIARI